MIELRMGGPKATESPPIEPITIALSAKRSRRCLLV